MSRILPVASRKSIHMNGSCKLQSHTAFMMVYQIGKTKVFLRAGQMAELDARRAEVLGNAARVIQRQIRTHIARKEFIALRQAAICLQSNLRGTLCCLFICLFSSS